MITIAYRKAIELLETVSTNQGFLASATHETNYKRVWARDGVICGLAALASGNVNLIKTFENTLLTLEKHQHPSGTIPSNVYFFEDKTEVSYGGLAGRVDAQTWYVIGCCQYAFYTDDSHWLKNRMASIERVLQLLEAWEFNNKHLVYTPLSGNWADEYVLEGYVLYDQVLRLWALKSYQYFKNDALLALKIKRVEQQIISNFFPEATQNIVHPKAYSKVDFSAYLPCSFSPSGYKKYFDALAHSLLCLIDLGDEKVYKNALVFGQNLAKNLPLQLVPAFAPTIFETDTDWHLLKDNCKYDFRNYPNEFHNGGSWQMVNGFWGLALLNKGFTTEANKLLEALAQANAYENYGFYENFNSQTAQPNGVKYCSWSAAAQVLVHQQIHQPFKFLV